MKVATFLRNAWVAADYSQKGLADHPEYHAAKTEGDVDAALRLVEKCLDDAYLADIKMSLADMERKGMKKPVIVAPYRAGSKNMIARAFAAYLSEHTGLEVDNNIIVKPGQSQRTKSKWERIVNGPEFSGKIAAGTPVIGVDDAVSSGGTFKDLESYVNSIGGRYIGSYALASPRGESFNLKPLPRHIDKVHTALGSKITKWLENKIGYDISCSTRPEACFFSSRGGVEEILRQYRLSPG